jgi:hypothetical protein
LFGGLSILDASFGMVLVIRIIFQNDDNVQEFMLMEPLLSLTLDFVGK